MKTWQCHKKVKAFKIGGVELDDTGWNGHVLVPEDPTVDPVFVSVEYFIKHNPKAGGYYVRYEGGYESWSPADAFESGYTELPE